MLQTSHSTEDSQPRRGGQRVEILNILECKGRDVAKEGRGEIRATPVQEYFAELGGYGCRRDVYVKTFEAKVPDFQRAQQLS